MTQRLKDRPLMDFAPDDADYIWVRDKNDTTDGPDGTDKRLPISELFKASPATIQHNLTATDDPTATDDETEGYEPRSLWMNTTSNEIFMCLDATTDNAVWELITFNVDEVGGSLVVNTDGLRLVGDEDAPGNENYYGTDSGGVKGYHPLPVGEFLDHTDTPSQYATDDGKKLVRVKAALDGLEFVAVTGVDDAILSGTKGANGNVVQWNADGDAVDGGLAVSNIVDLGSAQTITGTKTFDNSEVALDRSAGLVRDLRWKSDGNNRWIIRGTSESESGSDTGTNFEIIARNDSGGPIDTPLRLVRASGGALTIKRPVVVGSPTGGSQGPGTLAVENGIGFGQTLLDFFEEGSFTPTLLIGGSEGTTTYNSNIGKYVAKGNEVGITIRIFVDTLDTSLTGNVTVGGLPFPTTNANGGMSLGKSRDIQWGSYAVAQGGKSASHIELYKGDPSATLDAKVTEADIGTTLILIISGIYLR